MMVKSANSVYIILIIQDFFSDKVNCLYIYMKRATLSKLTKPFPPLNIILICFGFETKFKSHLADLCKPRNNFHENCSSIKMHRFGHVWEILSKIGRVFQLQSNWNQLPKVLKKISSSQFRGVCPSKLIRLPPDSLFHCLPRAILTRPWKDEKDRSVYQRGIWYKQRF